MRVSLSCRLGAWVLLPLWCAAALAEPVGDGSTIDLKEAIKRTLERNPSLIAFGYQIEAQEGRLLQSGLKPNPELNVLIENVLGSDEFQGVDSAETTLSLAWALERGKRESRVAAARAGVSVLEVEADVTRLDAAAETARAFFESLANQERLIRTEEAVELSAQTVAALQARVQAGKTPKADLARAEAQLARARLDREDVEHELLSAKRRLSAQWGETEPEFDRVGGDIAVLPVLETFGHLLERIDQNPDIARYLTERRLREAELRLAETEAKPSWRVTAGVRRFDQTDDQALVAGIAFPLAFRDRNQGNIAEARANLARTEADRETTRIRIETQLFALHQELQHSLHRVTTLRNDIVPRAEQALADTQRAYELGRYGYFELQVVQAELLNARTALVEASIDAHRYAIEIERLTGVTRASPAAIP